MAGVRGCSRCWNCCMLSKFNSFLTSVPGFLIGGFLILIPSIFELGFGIRIPQLASRILYVVGAIALLYSIVMVFVKKS